MFCTQITKYSLYSVFDNLYSLYPIYCLYLIYSICFYYTNLSIQVRDRYLVTSGFPSIRYHIYNTRGSGGVERGHVSPYLVPSATATPAVSSSRTAMTWWIHLVVLQVVELQLPEPLVFLLSGWGGLDILLELWLDPYWRPLGL